MSAMDRHRSGSPEGKHFSGPSRLIMVVDDDAEIRAAIRLCLPREYEVIGLASGEEFLEMAEAYQPDLIILDIHLPGRDGFRLCRELRSRPDLGRTPVLFLTVLAEGAGFLKGLKTEGNAYLSKPFDPRELLSIIKRLLDEAPI